MKQFIKEDRATWRYFWAHWFAVQMVAITVGAWKFKYLFHDWYKPWLKMFGVKYSKIQQYHRHHSKHHPEWLLSRLEKMDLRRESAYDLFDKFNWEEMLIDWQASKYTKEACPRGAAKELENYLAFIRKNPKYSKLTKYHFIAAVKYYCIPIIHKYRFKD